MNIFSSENIYQRQTRLIREAGLPAESSTFEVEAGNPLIETSEEDGTVYSWTVAVPETLIREAGWVSEQYADDREMSARQEAEEETRANLQSELRDALDSLVRAAEFGRLDDVVSPTDLILYGEAVATARAAMDIAMQSIGAMEEWRRA